MMMRTSNRAVEMMRSVGGGGSYAGQSYYSETEEKISILTEPQVIMMSQRNESVLE